MAGDLFGMFKNTPQAAGLIQWLTTPEAQSIWVKRGGALSPNKLVGQDVYPDPVSKQLAQTLVSAQTPKFDASDQMPTAMQNAFYKGVLDFVKDPGSLDSILSSLDKTQSTSS